ncbi:MAG: universal stress protein [Balneolales bacterium]
MMNKLDRIVVPTDFSKGARAACRYANFLSGTFGGTVDLLHRIPTLSYFQDSLKKMGVPISMEKDYIPQIEKDTKAYLKEDMDKYIQKGHQGKCFSVIGPNAARSIVDFVHRGKYDIIVLGSRGDSAEHYIKMGSVTTRIVKLSQIPVITVPDKPKLKSIHNIVVPTDLSDESLQALSPAAFIANKTGAKITLFHVLELYGALSDTHGIPSGTSSLKKISDRILKKVQDFLELYEKNKLRLEVDSYGDNHIILYTDSSGETGSIPVTTEIDRGFSAHYLIVKYADEYADLIVISTHGRSALPHLLLGSTAEKAIRWAEVPVISHRSTL